MNSLRRVFAAVELFLVFPAALFMTALFLRNVQPAPYQPAEAARHVVDWYGARPMLCLGIFLIAMPLLAVTIGGTTVFRSWRRDAGFRAAATQSLSLLRPHISALVIAVATLLAGGILAVVGLHVITD